jgi:hypothetical protein
MVRDGACAIRRVSASSNGVLSSSVVAPNRRSSDAISSLGINSLSDPEGRKPVAALDHVLGVRGQDAAGAKPLCTGFAASAGGGAIEQLTGGFQVADWLVGYGRSKSRPAARAIVNDGAHASVPSSVSAGVAAKPISSGSMPSSMAQASRSATAMARAVSAS